MVSQRSIYGMEAGASGGQGFAVNHNIAQASKGPFGGYVVCQALRQLQGYPLVQGHAPGTLHRRYREEREHLWHCQEVLVIRRRPLRDDKFIGVELDLLNEFQIYKNLTFKVFGGYLWAGNALDLFAGGTTGNFADA